MKRNAAGQLVPGYNGDPMERFLRNCQFDPGTGCVLWTGATTCGRGNSAPYPAFWFEGRRWFGHRWSAKYIHGLDIDGMHVDHCCPEHNHLTAPNTLCVQHVQVLTPAQNAALRWVRVRVGLDEPPPVAEEAPFTAVPMYDPPAWLPRKTVTDDPPF